MTSDPKTVHLAEQQLAKLAQPHADGTLSDEDFKALKAKLISQISDEHTEKSLDGAGKHRCAIGNLC